jgi:hypothetical protein
VALQGSLDTFSLPDVLRLLATTGKTGCLHVDGDRGRGSVWLADGSVVSADADRALDAAPVDEVIFEMLRFGRGSFRFAADEQAPGDAQQPKEIESTLRRATQLLDEWRELEAVVPSLSHRVAMAPKLTVDQVTVDAPRWEALVAIASGRSIGDLAEALNLGELDISRMVSDLVELGVAVVEPPGAARAPSSTGRRSTTDDLPSRTTTGEVPRRTAPPRPATPTPEPAVVARRDSGAVTAGENGRGSWLAGEASDRDPTGDGENPRRSSYPSAASSADTTEDRPRPRRKTSTTLTAPTTSVRSAAATVTSARNGQAIPTSPMAPPPNPSLPPATPLPPTSPPATPLPPTSPLAPSPPPALPDPSRAPLLPPSLDTGRLGPSPLPRQTGQIPAVAASALPPDLSWAADDKDVGAMGPLATAPMPTTEAPLPNGPRPYAAPVVPPAPAPGRMSPPPAAHPTNGRGDGETAMHVAAMSDDARSAVETTVGRNGGGPGGMSMAGVSPEQVMHRSHLLKFLSSVR